MTPTEREVELEYANAIQTGVLLRCTKLIDAQIDDPIDLLVLLSCLAGTLICARFIDPIEQQAAVSSVAEATSKIVAARSNPHNV